MIAYAKGARFLAQSKNQFSQSVLESATVEYRSALLAPIARHKDALDALEAGIRNELYGTPRIER